MSHTTIYFIRHCEPDKSKFDDEFNCPLTAKGQEDCAKVTGFLRDKDIDVISSSPYVRTVETVKPFAESVGLGIELVNDFREWNIGRGWINSAEEYRSFIKRHWDNFSHQEGASERLADIQNRNIAALQKILDKHSGKNIVIGAHGMALSTIINHFDKAFGLEEFLSIAGLWPWIVRMDFDENCSFVKWLAMPFGDK